MPEKTPVFKLSWRFFKDAIKTYRANWKLFVGIVLVVSIPASIASVYLIDPATDSSLTAYLTLAQLAMNAAVIYAIFKLHAKEPVSVKDAYYNGSAGFIRLVLTAFVLVIISLLLVFGLLILFLGLLVPETALALGEKLLISLLSLILLVPGFYLLARTVLSLFVVFDSPKGPLQAVAESWRLTAGKGWKSQGVLFFMLIFIFLLVLVPAALLVVLLSLTQVLFFQLLLQVLVGITVLPISNLYLFNYYQGLKK